MHDPLNLNIILWMVFLSPLILYGVIVWTTILILLPVCLILKIVNFILKKLFCNPCSSTVVMDFRQVCKTAWRTARHPSIILDMLKRLLFEIKEKNKKSTNQEIFTIEEIENYGSNPNFQYNSKLHSACILSYASLFTAIIWPRYIYLDSIGVDAFEINFAFFFIVYLCFFLPCCWLSVYVPKRDHLSEEEILAFLTSSPECVCYVHVSCFHREGTGNDATTVNTFKTDEPVPITKWTDKGKINNKFITSSLSNLLSQTGFIKLDLAIEASPADDETKKNLKLKKEKCYNKHKHRDQQISTNIHYSMTRNGGRVNSVIVFKQGTSVPNHWLSNTELLVYVLFLIQGLPILAVILLLWKKKTWKIIFKKKINYYADELQDPTSNIKEIRTILKKNSAPMMDLQIVGSGNPTSFNTEEVVLTSVKMSYV